MNLFERHTMYLGIHFYRSVNITYIRHFISYIQFNLGLSPRPKLSENSTKTPKGLSQSKTPGKYSKMPTQKGKTPSKTPNKQSGPDRLDTQVSVYAFLYHNYIGVCVLVMLIYNV